MRSNYKQLGTYIKQIDIRNTNNAVTYLRGVSSVHKCLMQSKANIIGTDMSTYKLVSKNQFVFNPNTARMGDKIPIALNDGDDCIVSQIYPVFDIIDHEVLSPEYLMMWFKRPEFDRYARFKSHGSAREIFDWLEMCEVQLPIPHINKQREIVKEYKVLVDRINLNNQLIQKLEETAQAIYKQWFVNFEFPDENGKPYKSNDGEMEFNDVLEKDIPKGWELKKIGEIIKTIGGGTPATEEKEYWENGDILWFSPTDVTKNDNIFSSNTENKITKLGLQKSSAKIFPAYSLLMTSRATIGKLVINTKEATTNQGFIILLPTKSFSVYYLFDWVKTQLEEINSLASGSTFPEINKSDFRNLKIIISNGTILRKYNELVTPIFNRINNLVEEKNIFESMKNLLLSKLATLNN